MRSLLNTFRRRPASTASVLPSSPQLDAAQTTVPSSVTNSAPSSSQDSESLDSESLDSESAKSEPPENPTKLSSEAAWQIVMALMVPAMLMPISSSTSRVALPIIRDDFGISADMTAWVTTSYTLPFMILMPVYGRLSDGVGRRRLLLLGITIFAVGTAITLSTNSLAMLMLGRAIQGIGTAGITPLGMAIISTIFSAEARGKALGTWSSIGPVAAALAPPAAGFLIDWGGGWRWAFVPGLVLSTAALFAVYRFVPAGLSKVQPAYWRRFDWTGVFLLAGTLTCFLFFLSSRPITGVEPLRDWRLLTGILLFLGSFLWWEQRRQNPFVALGVFTNRMFTVASCSAALRMMTMAGLGFLTPLYLSDIYQMNASTMGFVLMIMPGAMMFMVRFGGQLSDRLGSQTPVVFGFIAQIMVALLFSFVNRQTPLWIFCSILALHGFGVGLMLAALHSAALKEIGDEQMGVAAGLYSMIRFTGMATGTALSGVLLQNYFNQSLPVIEAYQSTFRVFAISAILGLALAIVGLSGKQSRQTEPTLS